MKKLFTLIAVLLLLGSCRYKELCYDHHHTQDPNLELELSLKLDLDIDLDVSEEAHTTIEIPSYMVASFYDPLTGALSEKEFVGPEGGPIHVEPGTYKMVVYSFDTEWTDVRGESDINTLEAFTSDVTALKSPQFSHFYHSSSRLEAPGPIIYTPDHLLVTRKEVEIPPYSMEKQVITISATASTVVETYGFEVPNITGVEYIASADAFVTNQARSCFFGRGEKSTDPATIYFPLEVNKEKGTLKTTFNTFGKLPGESHCFLHILLVDTEGNPYTITEDITDQFENPDHTIEVEGEIDIPEPEGGGTGIAPSVEDWEEENHDIPIG